MYSFPWQEWGYLDVVVDTDFAGCTATRQSTSGGCLFHGQHLFKHWASTQKTVALSSGEAEYYAALKGASVALGFESMAKDLGESVRIRLFSDSATLPSRNLTINHSLF